MNEAKRLKALEEEKRRRKCLMAQGAESADHEGRAGKQTMTTTRRAARRSTRRKAQYRERAGSVSDPGVERTALRCVLPPAIADGQWRVRELAARLPRAGVSRFD